ncbi:MAG: hypothetical protein PVH49_05750, partial [Syntrophobacterales bacterium]
SVQAIAKRFHQPQQTAGRDLRVKHHTIFAYDHILDYSLLPQKYSRSISAHSPPVASFVLLKQTFFVLSKQELV